MKVPEWVSTLGVVLSESWVLILVSVMIMIIVLSWMWKKINSLTMKVLSMIFILPASLGIGAMDTANSLYEEYCPQVKCSELGEDLSDLYNEKKSELFN